MRAVGLRNAVLSAVLLIGVAPSGVAAQTRYDPLSVPDIAALAPPRDYDVRDSARQRTVPIRVYRPATSDSAAPVLLFSHGLGGARTNNAYIGRHWSARGYVVVFLQHPGSDEDVWQDVPLRRRMAEMRRAASAQNLMLRVRDVPVVLDRLATWNADSAHDLHGALDLTRVGMSGHSFGAVTTQAVSGQTLPTGQAPFRDTRIDAAVIMSPSAPQRGSAEAAFGKVGIPWLLMTGTKDEAAVGNATLDDRLAVYPALPPGSKYELVLHNAEHSAFSDRALPGDRVARNANHHRAILALSTAFWDAHLKRDSRAQVWLDGAGAKAVLEAQDRWQRK